MRKSIGAVILAATVFSVGISSFGYVDYNASADQESTVPIGSVSYETALLSDDTPVMVEKEVLTFDISDFPVFDGAKFINSQEYSAKVTADYSLYNPEQEDVTVHLALPLGKCAEYLIYDDDEEEMYDDLSRYRIAIDGEEVESTVRHTYQADNTFNLNEGIDKLKETTIDRFYNYHTEVKRYTCSVTLPEFTGKKYLLRLECDFNPIRTHIYAPVYYKAFLENGKTVITSWIKDSEKDFTFYVIGKTTNAEISASVVEYSTEAVCYSGEEAETGSVVVNLVSTESYTEFLAENKPSSMISDRDWYRIASEFLRCDDLNCGVAGGELSSLGKINLMRWLEYSVVIPANTRIRHTITAPLYPTAASGGNYYKYNLSPAQTWADYGEIEIQLKTPYRISSASLEFEENENGYVFTRTSLPSGELMFRLANETVQQGDYSPYKNKFPATTTALILLGVVVTAAFVTVSVFVVRTKKQQKALADSDYNRFRANIREGKVDIDPQDPEEQ